MSDSRGTLNLNKALIVSVIAIILAIASFAYMYVTFTGLQGKIDTLTNQLDQLTDYVAPEGLDMIFAAQREGIVVWHSSISTVTGPSVIRAFEAKYPGITVQWTGGDTTPMLTSFITQQQAGVYFADVCQLSGQDVATDMKNRGYIEFYNSSLYAPYDAANKDTGYWFDMRSSVWIPTYNKNLVNASEITKWTDLLAPKFYGKVEMQSPLTSNLWYVYWILKQTPGLGTDFWRQLHANGLVLTSGATQPYEDVSSGAMMVTLSAHQVQIAKYKANGAPIEVAPINPCTYYTGSAWIAKGAPHPNAAKLFMDFLLSMEGQKAVASAGEYSLLPGAPSPTNAPLLSTIPLASINMTQFLASKEALVAEMHDVFEIPG